MSQTSGKNCEKKCACNKTFLPPSMPRQNSIGWCNDQTRLLQACGTSFFIYEPYSETTAKTLCGMCCITCCPPTIGAQKLRLILTLYNHSYNKPILAVPSQVRLHTYASPLAQKSPQSPSLLSRRSIFWYTHTYHRNKIAHGEIFNRKPNEEEAIWWHGRLYWCRQAEQQPRTCNSSRHNFCCLITQVHCWVFRTSNVP